MKYFDINTVVNAYNGFQDCMTNKSWGYLALLKGCDSSILPLTPYEVDLNTVSNFLEGIFNLSPQKRQYDGGNILHVVFSNKWDNYFNDQGRMSPNIYDVIVWAYRRRAFPDNISQNEIIGIFLREFNIPQSVLTSSFNIQQKEISFSDYLYQETDLKTNLRNINVDVSENNIDAKKKAIVASPGEISRGPFVQPLYAGLEITDYVLILQSDYYTLYGNKNAFDTTSNPTLQQIFYGAPGTGKSHEVKKLTGELLDKGNEVDLPNVFRTTFHPDTDYASFVGCYKPTMKPTSKEEKTLTGKDEEIVYEFVPQVFTDAYVYAYNNSDQPTYLVIEEINRGNCAQIFGDLFQLLDRKGGVSEYKIKADKDLAQYLKEKLGVDSEGIQDGKLCLPANLYILATMNTSDQSLFPMDSAFKRRWEWEYVPINYNDTIKSGTFDITIGEKPNEKSYSWVGFIKKVNEKIFDLTQSEDKQMGNFFIKQSIDEKGFKSKVMFYLWYEVLRDETENNKYFFYKKTSVEGKDVLSKFTFKDLFGDKATETLQQFMAYLEVDPK